MAYGLQVVDCGLFGRVHPVLGVDVEGTWIAGLDEAANEGRGDAVLTWNPEAAARFDTAGEALEAYRTVHPGHPVRAMDGQPNRPLMAYTITVARLP